ncbi:hypothetical protein D3C80_93580 [compost metagenome]
MVGYHKLLERVSSIKTLSESHRMRVGQIKAQCDNDQSKLPEHILQELKNIYNGYGSNTWNVNT